MLQMQGRLKGAQAPPSDAGKEDLALFGGEVLAFCGSPKPKLHCTDPRNVSITPSLPDVTNLTFETMINKLTTVSFLACLCFITIHYCYSETMILLNSFKQCKVGRFMPHVVGILAEHQRINRCLQPRIHFLPFILASNVSAQEIFKVLPKPISFLCSQKLVLTLCRFGSGFDKFHFVEALPYNNQCEYVPCFEVGV